MSEQLDDENLIILDTTVLVSVDAKGGFSIQSDKQAYNQGHIPNAGFADLLGNLSARDTQLKFVMPSLEQFRLAIEDLGINNESTVVIYATESMESRRKTFINLIT